MKPITDMISAELRIACAEKCGWEFQKCVDSKFGWIYDPEGRSINVCCDFLDDAKLGNYPDYEHDRNALFELVKTIPKDKRDDFIKALADILGFDLQLFTDGETLAGNIMDVIWDLLIADPIAIMRAFLTVMDDNR